MRMETDNKELDQNSIKNQRDSRPKHNDSNIKAKEEYNSMKTEENDQCKYEYENICRETNQGGNFQRQFMNRFSAIQSAELEMKNGLPYKSPLGESIASVSSSKKKEKNHCPLYYGIKSYIHDFYGPPDKDILKSGEFMQGDDFRFLAEPRRQTRNCWIRLGFWIGVNLSLLGIVAMLVGYLTPQRDTIVGQFDGFFILDRWAVTFNNRLILCQLIGLVTFLCGIVFIICSHVLSTCQPEETPTYYVMGATVLPESFVGSPLADPRHTYGLHCIPLSGIIKGVQPTFIRSQY